MSLAFLRMKGTDFSPYIKRSISKRTSAPEGKHTCADNAQSNSCLSKSAQTLASLTLILAAITASAQSPLADSPTRSILHGAAVEYLYPEQVSVPGGKPTQVALHFRIAPGFHINSHTPKGDFLIPTSLSIPEASGVALKNAIYPNGTDFTLPLDPGTKLSVYTGEFAIQANLIAQPGNHLVQASLRYQACDRNACMPPKTITVPIDVIGQ